MVNGKLIILIVEDDRPIRNLIATTLEIQKYKYITAENGVVAVSSIMSYNPDIILLDLGLPDIDGIDNATGATFSSDLAKELVKAAFAEHNGGAQ